MLKNLMDSFKKVFFIFLSERITGFIALTVLIMISLISHYIYNQG